MNTDRHARRRRRAQRRAATGGIDPIGVAEIGIGSNLSPDECPNAPGGQLSSKTAYCICCFTVDGAACILGVSTRTLARMRQEGVGPKWGLIGRRIVYPEDCLERFMRTRSQVASQRP